MSHYTVRVKDFIVEDGKIHAEASGRSVNGQLEYWMHVGRAAEANPDLGFAEINQYFHAISQINRKFEIEDYMLSQKAHILSKYQIQSTSRFTSYMNSMDYTQRTFIDREIHALVDRPEKGKRLHGPFRSLRVYELDEKFKCDPILYYFVGFTKEFILI